MNVITNIEDLRVLAQKRVPRMFYDYADSGAYTESTYRANESDLKTIKFRQRVAVNIDNRSLKSDMVGEPVAMPVALAPMTGRPEAIASKVTLPKVSVVLGLRKTSTEA